MRLKNYLIIFITLLIALSLTAVPILTSCTGADEGPEEEEEEEDTTVYTGIFTTDMSFSDPSAQLQAEQYAMWEEVTNGRVVIDCHWGGELFSEAAGVDAVSTGQAAITNAYPFILNEWDRRWEIYQLPFIFNDERHVEQWVTRSTKLADLVGDLKEHDIIPFPQFTWDTGTFAFYIFGTFPINTMDDMVGHKIRCQESPVLIRALELLGGQPTPIAFEEVSTALSTGMVDGLVGCEGESWAAAYGIYDYCSAKLVTPIYYSTSIDIMNQTWWESIPVDLRYKILEVIIEYNGRRMHLSECENGYSIERSAQLLEITEPTAAELDRWRTALQPLYDDFFSQVPAARPLADEIPDYVDYGI